MQNNAQRNTRAASVPRAMMHSVRIRGASVFGVQAHRCPSPRATQLACSFGGMLHRYSKQSGSSRLYDWSMREYIALLRPDISNRKRLARIPRH
jgi:hypothetical protein